MSLLDGRRFIVSSLFDNKMPYHYIVIADIQYWINNEPEIYAWMEDNLSRGRMHHHGMSVAMDNEEDVTAFLLKLG